MRRRAALLLPLLAAGCAGDDPPPPPPRVDAGPLRYDHLTPLRLNVGAVDVPDAPPPGPLDALNPSPPGRALRRMAMDRIGAGGSTGRAVFAIDDASIVQSGSNLAGVMAVHLDILGPDGERAAYAEARVARQAPMPRSAGLSAALQDMTRAMMDDMNVELEFQVRRALRDWLQLAETAPAPAPVQQEDLTPPGRPAEAVPFQRPPRPLRPAAPGS